MKRFGLVLVLFALAVGSFANGCASSTEGEFGKSLRFDKLPPQSEPTIESQRILSND